MSTTPTATAFYKLVLDARKAPLADRYSTKPVHEWTLTDTLISAEPVLLPTRFPSNTAKTELPLTLLQVPKADAMEMQHYNLFTRDDTQNHCVASENVREEKTDSMYVLEHVLDPKKPKSHALFFLLDQETKKPKDLVISFGRKNGCSNLAEMQLVTSDGKEPIVTSPEKLFQASKALSAAKTEEALKILSAKDGMEAKKLGSRTNLPMTEEELQKWGEVSLAKLLHCKLLSMQDPVFYLWLNSLRMYVEEHNIARVLFLEVGDENETEYTCGLMGDKIHEALLNNGMDDLFNKFGPAQSTMNKAGLVMAKVWEHFAEAKKMELEEWDKVLPLANLITETDTVQQDAKDAKDKGKDSPKRKFDDTK